MQNPSPEMLPEISFSSRQQEILKLYSQRVGAKLNGLKSKTKAPGVPGPGTPWPEVDELQKELLAFNQALSTGSGNKIRLSKMLGFWFVDELQSDIVPMNAVPDSSFPYSPRQEMRSIKGEGTFYELLHLFYVLGEGFIRAIGADALSKYHSLYGKR